MVTIITKNWLNKVNKNAHSSKRKMQALDDNGKLLVLTWKYLHDIVCMKTQVTEHYVW